MDHTLLMGMIREYLLDKHKCWSIRYDISDYEYKISSYRFAEIVIDPSNDEFRVVAKPRSRFKNGRAIARICRTLKANNIQYMHPSKILDNLSEIISIIERISICI